MDKQKAPVIQPERYAVVGNPIKHSLSPTIHRLFAESTGQAMEYEKILVELSDFEVWTKRFFQEGGAGLNVTVPFKLRAFQLADQVSTRAQLAGAANTLGINQAGQIWADNTDGAGLVRDIANRGYELAGKSIVILGAGGAVRGVTGVLLDQHPASVTIVNRTLSKAEEISELFNSRSLSACSLDECEKLGAPDWLISGLSSGLDDQLPVLPASLIGAHTRAYDMIYGPQDTPFIRWARQHRAQSTLDGLGMLVEQAAESFFLWRHTRPATEGITRILRDHLT